MNRFYFDVHVPAAIADGLRRRNVDVLRAQEDGAGRLPDSALLDRATELGRVLVSPDKDFTSEVAQRQRTVWHIHRRYPDTLGSHSFWRTRTRIGIDRQCNGTRRISGSHHLCAALNSCSSFAGVSHSATSPRCVPGFSDSHRAS